MRHQTAIVVADPDSWTREALRVYVEAPGAPSAARLLSRRFPVDVTVEVGSRTYLTYREGVLTKAARFVDFIIPREDGKDAEEQLTVKLLETNEPWFSRVYAPQD